MNPLLLPVSLHSYLPFNTWAKLNSLWLLPNGARKALVTRLVWLERDWFIAFAIFSPIFYSVNAPIVIIFLKLFMQGQVLWKLGFNFPQVHISTGEFDLKASSVQFPWVEQCSSWVCRTPICPLKPGLPSWLVLCFSSAVQVLWCWCHHHCL